MPLLICIILCLQALALHGQQRLKFERISRGLSNTNISFITQDREGYMWFGTADGLNRYDGGGVTVFKNIPGDSTSLIDNTISSIYQTRDGNIWLGTYNNCCFFTPATQRFTRVIKEQNLYVNQLYEDERGLLWVTTNKGLCTYNRETRRWRDELTGQQLWHITPGSDGIIWLSGWNGFIKFNTKTRAYKNYILPKGHLAIRPTSVAGQSVIDNEGKLWFCTWENGLQRFDPVTETFESYYHQPGKPSLGGNITLGLLADGDNIWICNQFSGLVIYNKARKTFSNYRHEPADPFSLQGGYVTTIFKDSAGAVWIGTDQGVNKYHPSLNFFSTVYLNGEWGEKRQPAFWAMLEDRDGDLWAGDFLGLYRINPLSGRMEEYTRDVAGTADASFNDLVQDSSGVIWAAGRNWLYKIQKQQSANSVVLRPEKIPVPGMVVTCIKAGAGGRIYAAGMTGLYEYTPLTRQVRLFKPDSINTDVLTLTQIKPDEWLTGVRNMGLVLFNSNSKTFKKIALALPYNQEQPVLPSAIIQAGNFIWVSTHADGLLQLDTQYRLVKQFTESDGLPSMRILQLRTAGENIWLHTQAGLSCMNMPRRLFTNYGNTEGLINQYAINFLCGGNNRFYLSENGCIHYFNPDAANTGNHRMRVYITSLQAAGKTYYEPASVHLPYSRNNVTVNFIALNYYQTGGIAYMYQLEGAGGDWKSTGGSASVSFANLKEGHYTFRVKASVNGNEWTEAAAPFHFRIRPPFYRTWWFYLACAVLLAAAIAFLYWLQLKRIRTEEAIRDKIARDLHDDIGSTLSGINLYSKLALRKTAGADAELTAMLGKIEERTGGMMDAMSDIVWSIHPHNDTLANMLVRMKEYAAELFEARNIHYLFIMDSAIARQKLTLNTRKEIYLVFKEAVNNVVRHAQCGNARIELAVRQQQLVITVADDGKGIPPGHQTSGNGLNNMRARAEKINGRLEIEAAPGGGTVVQLIAPLTRIRYFR